MVKFLGSNAQAFFSKKQKDLAVKSILFVLKMSLVDNLESQPYMKIQLLAKYSNM